MFGITMTFADASLRKNPLRIDDLTRPDHVRLIPSDVCLYFGDYTPRAGYQHSEANQLIFNFKKPMNRKGLPDWHHKTSAIRKAAALFSQSYGPFLDELTFVPAPPSKPHGHVDHDNRLIEMLNLVADSNNSKPHIQELIRQPSARLAAHEGDVRPTIEQLIEQYNIEVGRSRDLRQTIAIVDDVLTNGTTFKAMDTILRASFPNRRIIGLFLARTVRVDVL